MIPPAEVDGWRVVRDPFLLFVDWRCQALTLEYNCWFSTDTTWAYSWTPYALRDDDDFDRNRRAFFTALFLEP